MIDQTCKALARLGRQTSPKGRRHPYCPPVIQVEKCLPESLNEGVDVNYGEKINNSTRRIRSLVGKGRPVQRLYFGSNESKKTDIEGEIFNSCCKIKRKARFDRSVKVLQAERDTWEENSPKLNIGQAPTVQEILSRIEEIFNVQIIWLDWRGRSSEGSIQHVAASNSQGRSRLASPWTEEVFIRREEVQYWWVD